MKKLLLGEWDRPEHVAEVSARQGFSKTNDEFSVEKLLSNPELVKLRAVERFGSRQTIVALNTSCLLVCLLPIES